MMANSRPVCMRSLFCVSVVPEMRPRKISDVIVHDLRKLLF